MIFLSLGNGRGSNSKHCVSILLRNFTFICNNYPVHLSVLKLAPAEYTTNAFSSK